MHLHAIAKGARMAWQAAAQFARRRLWFAGGPRLALGAMPTIPGVALLVTG
jgi:hypothetical protein